jgi:hypothetical protein
MKKIRMQSRKEMVKAVSGLTQNFVRLILHYWLGGLLNSRVRYTGSWQKAEKKWATGHQDRNYVQDGYSFHDNARMSSQDIDATEMEISPAALLEDVDTSTMTGVELKKHKDKMKKKAKKKKAKAKKAEKAKMETTEEATVETKAAMDVWAGSGMAAFDDAERALFHWHLFCRNSEGQNLSKAACAQLRRLQHPLWCKRWATVEGEVLKRSPLSAQFAADEAAQRGHTTALCPIWLFSPGEAIGGAAGKPQEAYANTTSPTIGMFHPSLYLNAKKMKKHEEKTKRHEQGQISQQQLDAVLETSKRDTRWRTRQHCSIKMTSLWLFETRVVLFPFLYVVLPPFLPLHNLPSFLPSCSPIFLPSCRLARNK